MSILVIGGTGTLGRQIVKQALDEGYQVKCLVRDFRRGAFLKDWGAELVYGDLSIPSTLPLAFKGVNIVIDSATVRSTSSYTSERIDWRGKLAILEASKLAGIKKFISFSVLNAAKNPSIPLMALKLKMEKKLEQSGINYTIFQCSGFFQGLISQYAIPILEKQPIWITSESTNINYIDTSDVAKFTLRSLALKEAECKEFPLVGLKAWNSKEIIQLCERLSGQAAKITQIPLGILILLKTVTGFFEWGTNISERLAFAEVLATGNNFTAEMQNTYDIFAFDKNDTISLESYMQDYFGRILRRLKELSDEKERSL